MAMKPNELDFVLCLVVIAIILKLLYDHGYWR